MQTRILIVAAVLAMLCPTLSSAGDIVVAKLDPSPVITDTSANFAIHKQTLRMTPLPKTKLAACAGRGSACGQGYPNDCCNGCYIQDGHSVGECN
jgi:hypothetical protein